MWIYYLEQLEQLEMEREVALLLTSPLHGLWLNHSPPT